MADENQHMIFVNWTEFKIKMSILRVNINLLIKVAPR